MAEQVREHASDLAEWIAPELVPPGRAWQRRQMSVAGAFALASLILAVLLGGHLVITTAFSEPAHPAVMRARSF